MKSRLRYVSAFIVAAGIIWINVVIVDKKVTNIGPLSDAVNEAGRYRMMALESVILIDRISMAPGDSTRALARLNEISTALHLFVEDLGQGTIPGTSFRFDAPTQVIVDSVLRQLTVLENILISVLTEMKDPTKLALESEMLQQLIDAGMIADLEQLATAISSRAGDELSEVMPQIVLQASIAALLIGLSMLVIFRPMESALVSEQETLTLQKGELEQLVQQRNQELQSYVDALEKANEELRRFARVASHDLKEPQRIVRSFLQLLTAHLGDDLDDKSRDYIDRIVRACDRMNTMIGSVLQLSRIERHADEFVDTDLNDIVSEVLETLDLTIKDTNAKITVEDLPRINGHPHHLQQLFMNLISNAIKFCRHQPEVLIRGDLAGDRAFILISDNGIGIDPAFNKQIFDVFARLHSGEEFEGSGIGLALCKKIVEVHGGNIEIAPGPTAGTTFKIEFPVSGIA